MDSNDDILKKCEYMLEQPLTTEDGFINEACMKELASVIRSMPPTYERLKDDPEWSKLIWTHWRDIVAGLAHCAIQNISDYYKNNDLEEVKTPISYVFPPGLENVLGYLAHCIRPKFDELGYAELSLCDINQILHETLMDQGISIFDGWNTEEVMGKYWLDLHALFHGVCILIRTQRRENDLFEKKFKEECPDG